MTWSDFAIDHEGRRIAVRDYGGEGPAVVLLHGGGGNLAGFDTLAPHLVPELSVVAYDAVGHGASDWAQPRDDLMVADLDAVIERLQLGAPYLVGSSMGGAVAQRFAASGRATAGIVAIDAALVETRDEVDARPYQEREEFERQARERGWGFRGTREETERWFAETAAGEDPPFEAHLRRSLQPVDGGFEQRPTIEHAYALRVTGLTMLPNESQAIDLYERIACPVLLLNAERGITPGGPYTDEQRARLNALPERHPNVEVKWLDAGHLIHWEKPKVVANLIREFVSRNRVA